jgi:hypothetical protein
MLAVLLICSLGQSPLECQRPTARSVLTHETEARLPYSCLMEAQQYAAMNSVTNRKKPNEWIKISCEPGQGQQTDDHL